MPSLKRGLSGQAYWRSLDELADAPEFRAHLENEFPGLDEALGAPSRRQFLKVMGASLAFAGLTGCRWPRETIVPYANRPEGVVPGIPLHYATALDIGGVATGLLAKSFDGRPIKIEGNELHPNSLGATNAMAQASVLQVYDPDRSRLPVEGEGQSRSWEQFDAFARAHFEPQRGGGSGICVLAEASSSPTRAAARARFEQAFPQASWFEYEPVSRDNERLGTAAAFGRPMRPILELGAADVIVAFDADLLLEHPASVRYTRDYARGRTASDGTMNRLYAVESTLSLTGSNADHRYAVRSSEIPAGIRTLARLLAARGVSLPGDVRGSADHGGEVPAFLEQIADDLASHRGHCVIAAGPRQPAEVHALAAALNVALGNAGETVRYVPEPDEARPTHADAIANLAARIDAGQVETLVLLGTNPAYNAPADLGFAEKLGKVGTTIHYGLYRDESARLCSWHAPAAHYLESWGDARGWDGTYSVVQPLIAPLYGGRTAEELLSLLAAGRVTSGYEQVRAVFGEKIAPGSGEPEWRRVLHDGLWDGTAWEAASVTVQGDSLRASSPGGAATRPAGDFEVVFVPDSRLLDGRFANNGWLQELADPITKLTWDNAALISPADASALGVRREDRVTISLDGRELTIPVYVLPGHARGSITLVLGHGRPAGGLVAEGAGFDVYALRTTKGMNVATGAQVRRAGGGRYRLATTQDHHAVVSAVGEPEVARRAHLLVREGTLEHYKEDPHFVQHIGHSLPLVQPFEQHRFSGRHQWGMTIDLSKCTGCSACVVACQSENNVPVVGKGEVLRGREMHWLRIDRYFKGDPNDEGGLQVAHQPMPCQHCENAPCEQVCPVAATVHDQEGLNVMVYNRCIGTRYCSNNCPWKVRRFNWFWNHHGPQHPRSVKVGEPYWLVTPDQADVTPIEKMVENPDVTVRTRGVMEKCTFCVQRINRAKIAARNESVTPTLGNEEAGYALADGSVIPACAQACPAEAITFGDLSDTGSAVHASFKHDRAYVTLEELNARPRNKYLAKLRNPVGGGSGEHHSGGDGHHASRERNHAWRA